MSNLLPLLDFIRENNSKIQSWIESKLEGDDITLYSSCDVRYSGFKITQVDANCFPAGFNNLNNDALQNAISSYTKFFTERNIKKVLIYPEFHTRNLGYLNNLLTIKSIFEKAGTEVRIIGNQKKCYKVEVSEKDIICYEAIEILNGILKTKKSNFTPDVIVLNNDLSLEFPNILQNLNIPVFPSPKFGWWQRLKTNHFQSYSKVVSEFANEFKIDPWFFDAYFDEVKDIDFKNNSHIDELFKKVSLLHEKISAKYQEYGIIKNPTIFIKSNRGTYGMGIHSVNNLEEISNFNKNIRKKMDVIRDGIKNTDVIIQEGVETIFHYNQKAVEPVVYSALSNPFGMFYRINEGSLANLNSKGMEFSNTFRISEDEEKLVKLIASFANIAIKNELYI